MFKFQYETKHLEYKSDQVAPSDYIEAKAIHFSEFLLILFGLTVMYHSSVLSTILTMSIFSTMFFRFTVFFNLASITVMFTTTIKKY